MGKSVRLWASAKWRPLVTPQKAWFPREGNGMDGLTLLVSNLGLMILLGLSLVVFNLLHARSWEILGT
jgi:hypothetical protein